MLARRSRTPGALGTGCTGRLWRFAKAVIISWSRSRGRRAHARCPSRCSGRARGGAGCARGRALVSAAAECRDRRGSCVRREPVGEARAPPLARPTSQCECICRCSAYSGASQSAGPCPCTELGKPRSAPNHNPFEYRQEGYEGKRVQKILGFISFVYADIGLALGAPLSGLKGSCLKHGAR